MTGRESLGPSRSYSLSHLASLGAPVGDSQDSSPRQGISRGMKRNSANPSSEFHFHSGRLYPHSRFSFEDEDEEEEEGLGKAVAREHEGILVGAGIDVEHEPKPGRNKYSSSWEQHQQPSGSSSSSSSSSGVRGVRISSDSRVQRSKRQQIVPGQQQVNGCDSYSQFLVANPKASREERREAVSRFFKARRSNNIF